MRAGIATYFLISILAVIVGLNTYNMYLMLEDDAFTISSIDSDIRVIGKEKTFTFRRSICSNKDLNISVQREIISHLDNSKVMLPKIDYTAYSIDGCYDTAFIVDLPEWLPAGEYTYRPILNYDVNDVLSKTLEAPSVKFKLLDLR